MNKSSSMMMGGSMETIVDQARGQAIGSHVRMTGKIMGIKLSLEEVATKREPPRHKARETSGQQRLLVIDNYRLGFNITESDKSSKLRVFIDYNLPAAPSLRRHINRVSGTTAPFRASPLGNDKKRIGVPGTTESRLR